MLQLNFHIFKHFFLKLKVFYRISTSILNEKFLKTARKARPSLSLPFWCALPILLRLFKHCNNIENLNTQSQIFFQVLLPCSHFNPFSQVLYFSCKYNGCFHGGSLSFLGSCHNAISLARPNQNLVENESHLLYIWVSFFNVSIIEQECLKYMESFISTKTYLLDMCCETL